MRNIFSAVRVVLAIAAAVVLGYLAFQSMTPLGKLAAALTVTG